MDRAFSLALGRAIGAAGAAEHLAAGTIPDKHDFLCADLGCQVLGIRVVLVGAEPDGSIPPYFRTCTTDAGCAAKMGYLKTPPANILQPRDCEVYEPTTATDRAYRYSRVVNGQRINLKSGTPIFMRRTGIPATKRTRVLPDQAEHALHHERRHATLYGLVDLVEGGQVAFGDQRISVDDGPERSVADLFFNMRFLDCLSPDHARRPYVFFGPATVGILENGSVRLAFADAIDFTLAFEPPQQSPLQVKASVFVNGECLRSSRRERLFRHDLAQLGVTSVEQKASLVAPCYAFVLGRLPGLTGKGFLNISAPDTTDDLVLLPRGQGEGFKGLRDHLWAERQKTETTRRLRVREADTSPTRRNDAGRQSRGPTKSTPMRLAPPAPDIRGEPKPSLAPQMEQPAVAPRSMADIFRRLADLLSGLTRP